jgi:hypothetical protein
VTPRCPYCLDDIHADEEPVRCAKCRTPHHSACFQENQVCVAYGCLSREEVPAGLSLFRKPLITLHHQANQEEPLGPFVLGWKVLPPVPEQRPPWRCPPAYARMSLEGREVREGEVLRGRAVIYTPKPLSFKRIDLCLLQGIARPEPVARLSLGDQEALRLDEGELPIGSHPFYLELQAPSTTGPVDPYLLEVVLVRGVLRGEVRSLPLPLFLLEQRYAPPRLPEPAGRPLAEPPGRGIPIRVAARDGAAPAGLPGVAGPGEPAPLFMPPPAHARGASPPAWHTVVEEGDPRRDRGRELLAGGWTELPVVSPSGIFSHDEATGRTIAARFFRCPSDDTSPNVQVPTLLATPELPVRITGGARIGSMSVAVHYEVVRPGGLEVMAPGFPATEEVRVLGSGALDAARFNGLSEGIELLVRIPRQRLQALARARTDGAHNATLRLRVALDAIEQGGRVVPCPTRTITYTGPVT